MGDPANPLWSTTVWSGNGEIDHNLVLTDIDLTGALPYLASNGLADNGAWYLEVTDDVPGDVGDIEDFQVRVNFDQTVYHYTGEPVPITDDVPQ